MENEKLIWTPKKVKVSELKLWEENPRTITQEAFEKLKDRIQSRGFHDVVKTDIDMTVLSGNQRRRALEELEMDEVWAMIPNRKLTEEEREKVAIESNMEDGRWDFEMLANFDEELLKEVGFESDFLDKIFKMDTGEDDFDVTAEIEKITDCKVKTGDLYALGGEVNCPKCGEIHKL
jgi:site-specific DNA-methyltransferase (adenine-specific)